MPRFPYIAAIFLLVLMMSAAVIAPNVTPQLLPQKADIEAELSAQLAAEATIDGDMRLRFLPAPQLIVENVRFLRKQEGSDLLALNVPVMVIDLSIADLMQHIAIVTGISLIEAKVTVEMAGSPADFVQRLSAQARPDIDILDGHFSIVGLNALQPQSITEIDRLSLTISGGEADAPLHISGYHRMSDGQQAFGRLQISSIAQQTALQLDMTLGRGERASFSGFLIRRGTDWQLDGEVALSSAALLTTHIESSLPLAVDEQARQVGLSGIIRATKFGVSAETMEVDLLNTVFRSRLSLAWPLSREDKPLLSGRLTTGLVDLDVLAPQKSAPGADSQLSRLWQSFAPELDVDLRVEATRFNLGGEAGRDLFLQFDWSGSEIDIDRFALNLPFSSTLSLAGKMDLAAADIGFAGSFSARSSDALAAMLWAGGRFNLDLAPFAERLDEARLQRVSLVGDALLNDAGLALNGLSGRIGDDFLTADIVLADSQGPQLDAVMRLDRLDFADWGLVESETAAGQESLTAVWQQLGRELALLLSAPNARRTIKLDAEVKRTFAGTRAMGAVAVEAELKDQKLSLGKLNLAGEDGSRISAIGSLSFTANPYFGDLAIGIEDPSGALIEDWLFSGFGPLRLAGNSGGEIGGELRANISLSGPDAPDWPRVTAVGRGSLGRLRADFEAGTPSRILALSQAGSNMILRLSGPANEMASGLSFPEIYRPQETAALEIDLRAQTNEVSALEGNLRMADDAMSLSGTLRPALSGARLAGAVDFSFGQVLAFFGPSTKPIPFSAIGQMQISSTSNELGFSALDMSFGDGRLSGEGVLKFDGRLPQLNMAIDADGVDLSWALPSFGKKGWRDAPMQWHLLSRGNADIGFQASNLSVGHVVLDELAGRIKLTDGVLEAPNLTVSAMQGKGTVNVQAEGGDLPPRFNLESSFTGINPAGFLLEHFGNRLVDARFDGSAQLSGRGSSAVNMMTSLAGELRYEIRPGVISVFDAIGFGDEVTDPKFTGRAAQIAEKYEGQAELSFARGLGLAAVREGLIDGSNDFVFAEGLNEAQLKLTLDLLSRKMQGGFTLYPVDRQRPVVWQIDGDIAEPRSKIDASAFDVISAPAPIEGPQPAE